MLPEDLKHYGRKSAIQEEMAGALLGAIAAAIAVGYILGRLTALLTP